MNKEKVKGGSGFRQNKPSTGTPLTSLIQKLRRLDTRAKPASGNASHVSTLPGIPPPSSIEVSQNKKSADHTADCMVLYEPHEPSRGAVEAMPARLEGKLVRSNAYEMSAPKSAARTAQSFNIRDTNSPRDAEKISLRSTTNQTPVPKPPQTTIAWQDNSNHTPSQRTDKSAAPCSRGTYSKSAFSTTKSLGNSMLDRRKSASDQAVMPEDSGVELDGSQGGGSYSGDLRNSALNIYESKRTPTASVSAEELSNRLSPSVTLASDRQTLRSITARQSQPASPQPGYEVYEPNSQTTYLDTGSSDPTAGSNAINSHQRLERIKREWNKPKDVNGTCAQTKSPNLHDAQIIVHSRSDVLHTPIKDINICPVHGKYSYNQKEGSETQEPEHTYVNSVMRGANLPVSRADGKLASRPVTAKSRMGALGRSQGRNMHKLSDFESDMESISGVSATSQEVAHITSVLRRKRVTHNQANKMRTGRNVSKTGYIDMRGGRRSRNKDKPNGMSKSLASFAEQSILSFLNNVDEPSEDDQQAYEHSTREFQHTTPSPPESHDEGASSPSKRGQLDRTPTNANDVGEEFELYAHPTLHDVASSYDLLPFTLGKSGYKSNSFGILVSKCPFLDTTPSPSSNENSPHATRSRLTGSSYSRRSRPSDSGLALVVVDELEEQGIAAYDGRIHTGDYVIEVNGHVTLEQTEVEVARLIESEDVLNLVVARARSKMSPGRRS